MPPSDRRLVDVGQIVASFGDVFQERGTSAQFSGERSEFRDHSGPACLKLRAQIVQDELPRFLVEAKVAVPRKARNPRLNLISHLLSGATEQRTKSLIEPELPPLIADEIKDEATGLAGVEPEPATHLLEKN